MPSFDQKTPEGAAKTILWTMEYVLPWHAPHPKAGRHVIRSEHELAELWASHGGETAKLPHVDFARHAPRLQSEAGR
jgi:hypothetical protein